MRHCSAGGHVDNRCELEYNDSGIRVAKTDFEDVNSDGDFDDTGTDTSVRTDYHVDHRNPTGYAQVLEEMQGAAVVKSYTIGHDVFVEAVSANQVRRLLTDGHGSTRALVDALGVVIQSGSTPQIYAYDAYGNALGFDPATAATDFLYSGEQTDSTGLQYLRARYYNPATGRFNRLDPFAGNIEDPQSLHKYLYAHGDPVNGVDPTGQFFGLAGLIAGIGMACLEYAMPGWEDLVLSGVEALANAYAVNLSWDIQWAQNWELSDSLCSRSDDLWVLSALGGGLYSAYDVYVPFYGVWNPLDSLSGNAAASCSWSRGNGLGGIGSAVRRFAGNNVARHSLRHAVEWANRMGKKFVSTVDYFTHPTLKDALGRVLYIVDYGDAVVHRLNLKGKETRVVDWDNATVAAKRAASNADMKAANEMLKESGVAKANGWTIDTRNRQVIIDGETYVWHHGRRKGEMELIPQGLHTNSKKSPASDHAGQMLWWCERLRSGRS